MSGRLRGPAAPVLSDRECRELSEHVMSMTSGSECEVGVSSSASASAALAQGRPYIAQDQVGSSVSFAVQIGDRQASGSTNQLDDASLRALVLEVESLVKERRTPGEWNEDTFPPLLPAQDYGRGPQIFFDSTVAAMAAEQQSEIITRAAAAAAKNGLIAAGQVSLSAGARSKLNTNGLWAYDRSTSSSFSLTARTKDGTGSGWGRSGYEDWNRVDPEAVITKAVDIALRSASPHAVEPGRYTVILEPEAVAPLLQMIIGFPTGGMAARSADNGLTVFSNKPRGTNKIGLQMMDRRLNMKSDPWDPERPGSTISENWRPLTAVSWLRSGVLQNLAYDPLYAREKGKTPVNNPDGVRLEADGPSQTLEEMIASTRRGIWVNRLSHVRSMNNEAVLLTGTTRDGTFLIENGKITKPIKNMRFTESPFFVLNRLEAWGEPRRASSDVVAPRLKVRDFNFTSLTDAV